MESSSQHNGSNVLIRIGDRPTSDVVVRLRTEEGGDDWVYCHSHILVDKSKYFAERLSDNWPTCQILDSRNCVKVYCEESDFDYYVNVLRLSYVMKDCSATYMWHGVRILHVAVKLGFPQIIVFGSSPLGRIRGGRDSENHTWHGIDRLWNQYLHDYSQLTTVLYSRFSYLLFNWLHHHPIAT